MPLNPTEPDNALDLLCSLNASLMSLHADIETLAERLNPALRDDAPTPAGSGTRGLSAPSPLARIVEERIDQVSRIHGTVLDLLSRLAL